MKSWKIVLQPTTRFVAMTLGNSEFESVKNYKCLPLNMPKGSFNNYVDRNLSFFDPPPLCVDIFHTLSVDKNRHFLTPSPLILSTYLLNGPLLQAPYARIWRDIFNLMRHFDYLITYFTISVIEFYWNFAQYLILVNNLEVLLCPSKYKSLL